MTGDGRVWSCDQCGATGEDHFEVCWRCGAPRAGYSADVEDPEPTPPPLPREVEEEVKTCPACGAGMDERGEIPFRVGGTEGWSLFREIKEFEETVWRIRIYACSGCRRLELYETEDEGE